MDTKNIMYKTKLNHIEIILKVIESVDISGMKVSEFYSRYVTMCRNGNIEPKSRIDFSRFVLYWFEKYKIAAKRFGNKVHRTIFKIIW